MHLKVKTQPEFNVKACRYHPYLLITLTFSARVRSFSKAYNKHWLFITLQKFEGTRYISQRRKNLVRKNILKYLQENVIFVIYGTL